MAIGSQEEDAAAAEDAEAGSSSRKQRVWYGSDAVLDTWLCTLSDDEDAMSTSSMSSSVSSADEVVGSPLGSLDGVVWSQGVILPRRGSSISSTRVITAAPVAQATKVMAPADSGSSGALRMR